MTQELLLVMDSDDPSQHQLIKLAITITFKLQIKCGEIRDASVSGILGARDIVVVVQLPKLKHNQLQYNVYKDVACEL